MISFNQTNLRNKSQFHGMVQIFYCDWKINHFYKVVRTGGRLASRQKETPRSKILVESWHNQEWKTSNNFWFVCPIVTFCQIYWFSRNWIFRYYCSLSWYHNIQIIFYSTTVSSSQNWHTLNQGQASASEAYFLVWVIEAPVVITNIIIFL